MDIRFLLLNQKQKAMAIKKNEVAKGVRVKLNSNFTPKCLGDEYLQCEQVIYIAEGHTYNDQKGDYVNLNGGSRTNSGYAYLDQLDLEFPYEGIQYPVNYKKTPLFKKEWIGFTKFWIGGHTAVFFGDEGKTEFDLKIKDEKECWEIYSKRLKITIEEIITPDND